MRSLGHRTTTCPNAVSSSSNAPTASSTHRECEASAGSAPQCDFERLSTDRRVGKECGTAYTGSGGSTWDQVGIRPTDTGRQKRLKGPWGEGEL